MMMNRDRLSSVSKPERLRQAAFRVIDRTQDTPEDQLRGIALALLAACEATGVNVRDLLITSERIMRDVDGPFSPAIRAIREYARNELRGY